MAAIERVLATAPPTAALPSAPQAHFRSTGNAVGEVAQQDPAPARNDPVNLETVDALLRQLYPDRGHSNSADISEFVEEIVSLGYTSLDLLKNVLEQADEALRRDEQANPPGRDMKPGTKYYDLGAARTALKLSDAKYRELYEAKFKKRSVRSPKTC